MGLVEAKLQASTAITNEVYFLPRNRCINFATFLVYSEPVIETPVFLQIHGEWELDMDRYFESQVYPPPSKGIRSLGPKIYQRVSRLSPSTGHGGHRHEAFCTTPKSRPDSGPVPIHFLSILPPPHHFSLKIGFSCNPASKKHFYFLNCESHSKESCFKAELCTDTVRHQGNILTTGPVSWELTSLAVQSSHSEAGGPAAGAHAKCLLTHRIPSTWALKAEHMAESQMGRKSP